MKTRIAVYIIGGFVLLILVLSAGFLNPEKKIKELTQTHSPIYMNYDGIKVIDLEESKIHWKGYKIIGNHSGTVNLLSGHIQFHDGRIIGGEFIADMSSILVTDLMEEEDQAEEEEDGDDKSELQEHLKSQHFFEIEKFPTATFRITSTKKIADNVIVTGHITIKAITKQVSFTPEIGTNTLQADLSIDRTEFGINFLSGSFFKDLGDMVILDKVDLHIVIKIAEEAPIAAIKN